MRILNIFDAVGRGTFEDFKKFYTGDVNIVSKNLDLNLLVMAVVNGENEEDKLKIINFLIKEGIDINYVDRKYKRNALHNFYFSVMRPSPVYMLEVTRILIENGIDVNGLDKFHSIPLNYAITVNKLPTTEIKEVYELLIKSGSKYHLKNQFNQSCVDNARKLSWRNDFLIICEECQNENEQ